MGAGPDRADRWARVACTVLCAAGLCGCPEARETVADDGQGSGVDTSAALVLAAAPPVEPIAFFERACANCHGPYGTFYGEGFARDLDDAALQRVVREMVVGPSRASLDDASLGALVAFHRQLADARGGPFVVVTRSAGGEVAGEVSPGARVEVVADGRDFEAHVDEHVWSVRLDGAPERSLIIRARFSEGGATTELDVSEAAWSHGRPRAGPDAPRGGGA